jgi:hypothetical protein
VVKTFDRHRCGIINAIETGANNARAERLNGAIQELKTSGRGYRNINNFRTAILFFYGDINKIPGGVLQSMLLHYFSEINVNEC